MADQQAVVIGAGVGGLAAAVDLAKAGWAVTVFDRADAVGGKMRQIDGVDAGPTVLTMAWVFEALFAEAGAHLDDFVALQQLDRLARHAWRDGSQLDLFRDRERSADAIGFFAGAENARGYLAFCREARRMYETLRAPFLQSPKPNPVSLAARIGPGRIDDLFAIRPFDTMWRALSAHFSDPRLRQLFGRYATYCGASPFAAPATLMLIAHVEQEGVWIVEGGMQRLAEALAQLATRLGVRIRLGEQVERILLKGGRASGVVITGEHALGADVVICNADPAALSAGLFGRDVLHATHPVKRERRSLSAVTWTMKASTQGFPLIRHNVFFSRDYAAEFSALKSGLPDDPTIYVCAQDRRDDAHSNDTERLLVLVNAPAHGDEAPASETEMEACEARMLARLQEAGLSIQPHSMTRTTPAQFDRLFPATGGALYGRATHGWAASFLRPGSKTKVPGLYLAGGGAHPGAGVPMAALSGRLAARQVLADRASMSPSRRAGTPGGISTR